MNLGQTQRLLISLGAKMSTCAEVLGLADVPEAERLAALG